MDEIPSTPTGTRRCRRTGVAVAGTFGALGIATAVVVAVGTGSATTSAAGIAASRQYPPTISFGRGRDGSRFSGPEGVGSGGYGSGGYGSGGLGSGGTGGGASATTTATADQQLGVVDIYTVVGFGTGQAAGTGMVLTSTGEILTNNHVIDGATSISVTVVSTGATYRATVVGTDPADDVAVLRLSGASGLQVADFGDTAAQVGAAVTAVGNAGGAGGAPSAVSGTVTALDQSITATDAAGGDAERLSGLIETDADVRPGDSGGSLYDTAAGEIIGMDTAATSGGNVVAYAIAISTALSIAQQIVGGLDTAAIHQGYPALLGVSVAPNGSGGAVIAGVLSGGPAESAGLPAGDVITAVDGTSIGSAADLTAALAAHEPGETVAVTWTDASGASQTAQVTLAAGPAD